MIRKLSRTGLLALLLSTSAMAAEPAVRERTGNVVFNPLGFLIGLANLGVDFKVGNHVVLGPNAQLGLIRGSSSQATTYGFGVSSTFFLNAPAFVDSWILNVTGSYAVAQAGGSSTSGLGLGANFGYWWFWESGFNLGLGIGVQYRTFNLAGLGLGNATGITPDALFRVGFTF